MAERNLFKPAPNSSVGGQATTSASSGAALPGVAASGPNQTSVLRIANKGLYAMRIELGFDTSVSATTNSMLIGPGDSEFIDRGTFTHFSVLGVAGALVSGITNGTTDYSITAGSGNL